MYGGKQKRKKNGNAMETILGAGTVFEGNMLSDGSVRVEGAFRGDVKVDHSLVIGPGGSVTGEVKAGGVVVFGEMNGKVDTGQLELKSSGRIKGDILVGTLIAEGGSLMNAKCEMKTPGTPAAAAPRKISAEQKKKPA